jgi:N-acetylmuramoyl-L-alanine amidase
MKKWRGIVIHCSDSSFGDNLIIDKWHKQNGWDGIGYNFVITNGKKTSKSVYLRSTDGAIKSGRVLSKDGSHALDYNDTHIGICLIGVKEFTDLQFRALQMLLKELVDQYSIELENIIGHYQCTTANGKTCPNFDVDVFKNKIFE